MSKGMTLLAYKAKCQGGGEGLEGLGEVGRRNKDGG